VIRDPFGGWDFDGIKQLAFMLVIFGSLVSFAASTGGRWYDPWNWIVIGIISYSTTFIILSMIVLLGLFWHERFMGGLH
jgi:hypothetical protein